MTVGLGGGVGGGGSGRSENDPAELARLGIDLGELNAREATRGETGESNMGRREGYDTGYRDRESDPMGEEYTALRGAGLGDVEAEGKSRVGWLGVNGPVVRVGVMRVCLMDDLMTGEGVEVSEMDENVGREKCVGVTDFIGESSF